jgi:hypothetical protein
MKKVSERREELRERAEGITRSSRKFRWWGLAFLFLGIGITLGGFPVGVLIYSLGFGLLLFSLIADLIAWRLKRRFRGT